MPSLTSKLLQATAVSTAATIAAFFVWTKHCQFADMSSATDPIFQSAFYKKYNPSANPTTHDLCIRKIPIFKLRPEQVEDAEQGGTKMVEAFCAGVWGGFGMLRTKIFNFNFFMSFLCHDNYYVPVLQKFVSEENPST
jgi:hypothetical protein